MTLAAEALRPPDEELEASERPRVLVVDDEVDLQELVSRALRKSCDVTTAGSAIQALELARRSAFDVVLLDIMMPGQSGLEVCRTLRRQSAPGSLAIVLLTALDDSENRWKGLEAGADDYLVKPFDLRELSLRVNHFALVVRQQRVIRAQVRALRELVELRDDLTALVVHDLRNPLVAVRLALQSIDQDCALEPSQRELVNLGLRSANQVMDATSDLLQIRLLEANRLPLRCEDVDLVGLTRGAVEIVRLAARERSVDVRFETAGVLSADLDPSLVRRALENLLANAVRHTQGTIDVEVLAAGGRAVVSVADRGDGVPDDLKDNLFEKFGSVALLKKNARRGHGLGLHLVRLVAQAHGGSVEVDDREGGGATFRLLLPVHRRPA